LTKLESSLSDFHEKLEELDDRASRDLTTLKSQMLTKADKDMIVEN